MLRACTFALALAACAGEPAPPPAQGETLALACTCDAEEDCDACFRRVGTCCYEDELIGGQVAALADRCASSGACRACCAECVGLSCEELIRRQMCPPIQPE